MGRRPSKRRDVAHWSIAEARRRFAELLRKAREGPQVVVNRGKPVAAVVGVETFEQFRAWSAHRTRRTLADAFDELRAIAAGDPCPLPAPSREDRPNPMADALD